MNRSPRVTRTPHVALPSLVAPAEAGASLGREVQEPRKAPAFAGATLGAGVMKESGV